jgi:transcriptional regulator GlxA family with amidase domain
VQRVAKAIAWLRENFSQYMKVANLAENDVMNNYGGI